MEEVLLVLTAAQVVRLRLLVEYEIKRNEVLSELIPSHDNCEYCRLEIDNLSGILDLLKV